MTSYLSVMLFAALAFLAIGSGIAISARCAKDARLSVALGVAIAPFLFGLASVIALSWFPGSDARTQLLVATCSLIFGSLFMPWTRVMIWKRPTALDAIAVFAIIGLAALLGALSLMTPLIANDPLEYATVARDIFEIRSLGNYPSLTPEITASGFYGAWTHPPLFVGSLHLANLIQGSADLSGLGRLIPVWFLVSSTALVYCVGRAVSSIAGFASAVLFIGIPVLADGAVNGAIDALPVAGATLVFACIATTIGSPYRRSLVVGLGLGLSLWAHSLSILLVPLALGGTAWYWGFQNWKAALQEVVAIIAVALLIAVWPYWYNYEVLGAAISDNPAVFALSSLNWESYFSLSRGLDTGPALIQYGLLKGFSETAFFGWTFWLATFCLPVVLFRLRGHIWPSNGLQVLVPNERILGVAALFFVLYFTFVAVSLVAGTTIMVKNERYLLIIAPVAVVLGGYLIDQAIAKTRFIYWRKPVRGVAMAAVFALAAIAIISIVAGWRDQVRTVFALSTEEARVQSLRSNIYVAPMLWASEHLPRDVKILAMRPSHMFYSGRKMVSYLDPLLLPFYAAPSAADAFDELKKARISHVQMPGYYIPPIYNSWLEHILANPTLARISYSDQAGNQIYELVPDAINFDETTDIGPGVRKWTANSIYPLFGVNMGRLWGASPKRLADDGVSSASFPFGLFHKAVFTTLHIGIAPEETGPEALFQLALSGKGYVTIFGQTDAGLFRLGELALDGDHDFSRRIKSPIPVHGFLLEHRGNSKIQLKAATLSKATKPQQP